MNELNMTCDINKDGVLSIKDCIFVDPFFTRWFEKYFMSIIRYFFDVEHISNMAQFISNWKDYKDDFEACLIGSIISYSMGAGQ